jgi:hypothetical protein
LEEDATRAVSELNNHSLHGRKIQLEIALKKGLNPMKDPSLREDGGDGADASKSKSSKATKPVQQPRSAISTGLEAITRGGSADSVTRPAESGEKAESKKKKQKKTKRAKKSNASEANEDVTLSEDVSSALESVVNQSSPSESNVPTKEGLSRARRLLMWGLPTGVNKQTLKKLVTKVCRKAEVSYIAEVSKFMRIISVNWLYDYNILMGNLQLICYADTPVSMRAVLLFVELLSRFTFARLF